MKSSLNKLSRSTYIRWIILFFIAVTDIWALKNPGLSFIVFLAPLIFVLLHSFKLFGKKHTFMIFGIIILVSFTAEYLGVHTGRVFGPYYYNPSAKVNGFLWAGVPPLVTFSYISMGYCSYVLSRIIFGKLGKLTGSAIAGVPIVAAMIMTMWDMSFDPIASYVNKIYTWYEGGAYLAVESLKKTCEYCGCNWLGFIHKTTEDEINPLTPKDIDNINEFADLFRS